MYLSRLILNLRSRRVQRELTEPYQMHRSIMRCFPDGISAYGERVLWRVDEHPQLGLVLLIQSLGRPDWSWIAEDPGARGYLLPVATVNPDCKEVHLSLTAGQILSFRLNANPTVKRGGKRLGLIKEEDQMAWLFRKAEQGGFKVLRVVIVKESNLLTKIRSLAGTEPIRMIGVRYDGFLRVEEPERLLKTLEKGVGSGKGFGFGLLSLAPTS